MILNLPIVRKNSQHQTWAVFSKASGIAAASRFSGHFSGIENGTVGSIAEREKRGTPKTKTAYKWY